MRRHTSRTCSKTHNYLTITIHLLPAACPPRVGLSWLEELQLQAWHDLHNKINKTYLYMYIHFCTTIYRPIPNSSTLSMLGLSFFNWQFTFLGALPPAVFGGQKDVFKIKPIFLSFFPLCLVMTPNCFPSNFNLPRPPIEPPGTCK